MAPPASCSVFPAGATGTRGQKWGVFAGYAAASDGAVACRFASRSGSLRFLPGAAAGRLKGDGPVWGGANASGGVGHNGVPLASGAGGGQRRVTGLNENAESLSTGRRKKYPH